MFKRKNDLTGIDRINAANDHLMTLQTTYSVGLQEIKDEDAALEAELKSIAARRNALKAGTKQGKEALNNVQAILPNDLVQKV